jgi:hypothetical protein
VGSGRGEGRREGERETGAVYLRLVDDGVPLVGVCRVVGPEGRIRGLVAGYPHGLPRQPLLLVAAVRLAVTVQHEGDVVPVDVEKCLRVKVVDERLPPSPQRAVGARVPILEAQGDGDAVAGEDLLDLVAR